MAAPACSQANLLAPCFLSPGPITPQQQKAFLIYAKMLQLAILGGTDYVGRLALLVQDASTLTCGMSEEDIRAAFVQIAFNNATSAGANVPATMNGKQAAINCMVELDQKRLEEIDLLLTCKLGVNKAYPQ
jgi:hypothetical protein